MPLSPSQENKDDLAFCKGATAKDSGELVCPHMSPVDFGKLFPEQPASKGKIRPELNP